MDLAIDTANNIYVAEQGNHVIRLIDAATATIHTIAGTGAAGYSGDGGPATSAQLNGPYAIAWNKQGNLYIADFNNQRIRRINLVTHIINTFAGTGVPGNTGDGGPAINATLYNPAGVTSDTADNVYLSSGGRIRKITASGTIITVTGNDGYGGDGLQADSALLQSPMHVCKDIAGNIYIADSGNHTVRKVNAAGVITTVAGNGQAGSTGDGSLATLATLNEPVSVAVNNQGDLFISDMAAHRIRRVDGATGNISTIAGSAPGYSGDGGAAVTALLNAPFGIALDTSGNLFISDNGNNRIRRIDASSGIINTIAGDGTPGFLGDGGLGTAAEFNSPAYITFDAFNNLYIADMYNNRVRKIDGVTGIINTIFGNGISGYGGDGGPATAAELCQPIGVAIDDTGGISITTCGKIRHVPTTGGPASVYAGNGLSGISPEGSPAGSSVFDGAAGIGYINGKLMIPDAGNHCVRYRKVTPPAGIISDRADTQVSFSLFPNPATNMVSIIGYVTGQNEYILITYTIADLYGKTLKDGRISIRDGIARDDITTEDLPANGLYFCTISAPGIKQTIVFSLQR